MYVRRLGLYSTIIRKNIHSLNNFVFKVRQVLWKKGYFHYNIILQN